MRAWGAGGGTAAVKGWGRGRTRLGLAIKPLLIPELGSEITKAGLWADGLVCSTEVAGLGRAWAEGNAGLASKSRGGPGQETEGGGGAFTTFTW